MELASSSIKTESESESSEEGKEALTTMQRGFRQGDSVVLAMTGIKKVGTIFTEFLNFYWKTIFQEKDDIGDSAELDSCDEDGGDGGDGGDVDPENPFEVCWLD